MLGEERQSAGRPGRHFPMCLIPCVLQDVLQLRDTLSEPAHSSSLAELKMNFTFSPLLSLPALGVAVSTGSQDHAKGACTSQGRLHLSPLIGWLQMTASPRFETSLVLPVRSRCKCDVQLRSLQRLGVLFRGIASFALHTLPSAIKRLRRAGPGLQAS